LEKSIEDALVQGISKGSESVR